MEELRMVDVYKWGKPEGKTLFEKVFDYRAKFHQFGVDFEELRDGVGRVSTAIVETTDGQLIGIPLSLVKFPNPTK